MPDWKTKLFFGYSLRIVREPVADRSVDLAMENQLSDLTYSTPQQKMLYLYETLREALRFKKYYAQEMNQYKRWNLVGDFLIAAAATTSLGSVAIFNWGDKPLKTLFLCSTFATILKPLLRPSRTIARFSKLQREYLNIYQKLDRLKREIQHFGQLLPQHEKKFGSLKDAFDRLGLQNEPVESNKKMRKIQDQIDEAIPPHSLWLPPSE